MKPKQIFEGNQFSYDEWVHDLICQLQIPNSKVYESHKTVGLSHFERFVSNSSNTYIYIYFFNFFEFGIGDNLSENIQKISEKWKKRNKHWHWKLHPEVSKEEKKAVSTISNVISEFKLGETK